MAEPNGHPAGMEDPRRLPGEPFGPSDIGGPDMADDRDPPTRVEDPNQPPSTPYGPHHGHVDDAAGGADSSPLDNLSSDERRAAAEEAKRKAGGKHYAGPGGESDR